ncbi:MAG: DEAD/DEAH box helicase [Patescibacteria group bacterium]
MKHLNHQDLEAAFPSRQYPKRLANQVEALEIIGNEKGSVILEMPTGSGKTAVGYTFLKALEQQGAGPLFYVVPTKTLVEQVHQLHPDVTVAYGRHEHPCLYYDDQPKADEIPCSMLVDCAHRVDQETGETFEPGATLCPYLLQKYQAKQSGIVVCTSAFYLFTQLFSREWGEPAGLVIDEAHRLPQTVRGLLSYEISDLHLWRAVNLLAFMDEEQAANLERFTKKMIHLVRRKASRASTLLEDHEIADLLDELAQVDPQKVRKAVAQAVQTGVIDTLEQRETLRKLELLTYNLRRYIHSLEYSLPSQGRHPLNYTYAYFRTDLIGNEKAQHWLFIKSYYVAPIIKRILSPRTLAFSATIGDPEIFQYETGIKAPAYALGSDFPAGNTRVFLPKDTPNLAVKGRIRAEPTKVLRRVAKACKSFAKSGMRSLVVVVSNVEREKFLRLCAEEEVNVLSYGGEVAPKDVAARFKAGEGDVLVGTVSNYGEGVDLPKSIAPVIFFLRPSYPNPRDPGTLFEERRFGSMRWRLWNWRVMLEALQVRGRNVRSSADVGVTFFISQQFRRFLYGALPEWLRESYCGDKTFEQCIEDAKELLRN